MQPVDFPAANGMAGGEIPVNRTHGIMLSRWGMTWRERLTILLIGKIWFAVQGYAMPPVLISGDRAFEIVNPPAAGVGCEGGDGAQS